MFENGFEGYVPQQEMGEHHFPYSAIIIPNGSDRSYAQLTEEERFDVGRDMWKKIKNVAFVLHMLRAKFISPTSLLPPA